MTFNRLTRILGPLKWGDPKLVNSKDCASRSGQLFSNKALVRLSDGKPTLMPLMVRSMRKLESIIREEMEKVAAYEILLPALVKESLLKSTGLDEKEELFKLTDRHKKKFVLAPTYEEVVTDLVSGQKLLRENSLPVRFYQINSKFRDEMHPKHGLVRAKEFIMKDLYCFDSCPEKRNDTYNEVLQQYHHLFKRLQLPFICASSSGSEMHCTQSHEFHFLSDLGDDAIIICKKCEQNINVNMVESNEKCPNCSNLNIDIVKGIEVGHTFNIGTSYSEMLKAYYFDQSGAEKCLELSSYGIGITRILGAGAEILSTEKELRWPLPLAPYLVCIISPKMGSTEDKVLEDATTEIYTNLNNHFKGDIVIDDRTKYTIGKRLLLDKGLGFPYIIVIGKEMLKDSPRIEVHDVNLDQRHMLHPSDVVSFIASKIT